MLSPETVALLERLCVQSRNVWDQGGFLYTFTEAADQAHSRIHQAVSQLRGISRKEPTPSIVYEEIKSRTSALGDIEIRELARFLDSARGDRLSEHPGDETINEAHDWLRSLHADLEFDAVWWSLDHDDGTSMTASLHMMRRSDNRYYSLWLFWSID
jgi:hypothetical protein